MAYPSICEACLEGRHDECEETWDQPTDPDPNAVGGAFCVCAHGKEESAFQRGVRKRMEKASNAS
jgi:hypothetical protein